jgi:3',5'-cyclic AMP phosphodiesterase CpdA
MVFRVVQLSDTHLSGERAYGAANFDAVVRTVNDDRPDLVVATGDLALDQPDNAADRAFARARFERIAVPWRAVPGNHDIGDDGDDPWMGEPVTEPRRAAWCEAWGPDWWAHDAGEWLLIGLDSLLFGSGLGAEARQAAWLEGVAASAGDASRPVAVFLHKPPWVWGEGEPADQKTMTMTGWQRLCAALGDAEVRVVSCGHLHQYRVAVRDGLAAVWAPSTCFISPGPSPYGGTKQVGALEWAFEGRTVSWRFVRPPGMVDLDVDELAGGAESLRFAPPWPAAP